MILMRLKSIVGASMKKLIFIVQFIFLFGLLKADIFPGSLPGVEIGANLPNGYEPSGSVWHNRLQKLFLVNDNGIVSNMDKDGNNVFSWNVVGDLEGICVADSTSNFVYIGVENPDKIIEFNFVSGLITRSFNLTPWMTGPSNMGLEALTFIPDSTNVEGGLFYAGLQYDGKIYVFELPITTSSTDTNVAYITSYTPVSGRWDISGLHYETSNGTLYAVWDSSNKLRAMESDCTNIVEWDLPGNDQEGITLCDGEGLNQNMVFIAEDTGKEVWKYDFNSQLVITINNNGSVLYEPDSPGYYGSFITLTAVPDPDNYFCNWSDDLISTNNPVTLLMDYNKNVTATFAFLNNPENVIIDISFDSVLIEWDVVPGATGYTVYSSDSPTGIFVPVTSGTYNETSWTSNIDETFRFYYITAIIVE